MNTTTTKIAGEAMQITDEQWKFNEWVTDLADPFWLKDAQKDGEFFDANGFARALLASKPAVTAGLPTEPSRPEYDADAVRFGACEHCSRRSNLHPHDGAMICGDCSGADYLSRWQDYAEQLRAMLVATQPDSKGKPTGKVVYVSDHDANAYCAILRILCMEEEGDPVAEVERLKALGATAPAQSRGDAEQADGAVDAFLAEVRAELIRARAKFPGDRIMTIALAEEFGELCKAVLDESAANVRKEAVQTAVMCARVVLDGDGSVNDWRAERGLDPLVKDSK
jgi:hypothetical protein